MSVITRSVEVDVPVAAAYEQWSQLEQLPRFMEGVEQIERLSDTTFRWHVSVAGIDRSFTAEITEQVPPETIAWRSTEGQQHSGRVRFASVQERRTQVEVEMEYDPQTWTDKVGDALNILDRRVEQDLQRFKAFVEEREGTAPPDKPGAVRDGGRTDELPPADDTGTNGVRPDDHQVPPTGGIPGGTPPDRS